MSNKLASFEYTLAANEEITISIKGDSIRGISGLYPYTVLFDGKNPLYNFQTALGVQLNETYSSVTLRNGDKAQKIGVYLGFAQSIDDNRLVGNVDITGGIRFSGAAASTYGAVTVSSSAVQIVEANAARSTVLIQNLGSDTVYLGADSSVTTSNGIALASGGSAEMKTESAVYGISATAGQDVRFWDDVTEVVA